MQLAPGRSAGCCTSLLETGDEFGLEEFETFERQVMFFNLAIDGDDLRVRCIGQQKIPPARAGAADRALRGASLVGQALQRRLGRGDCLSMVAGAFAPARRKHQANFGHQGHRYLRRDNQRWTRAGSTHLPARSRGATAR